MIERFSCISVDYRAAPAGVRSALACCRDQEAPAGASASKNVHPHARTPDPETGTVDGVAPHVETITLATCARYERYRFDGGAHVPNPLGYLPRACRRFARAYTGVDALHHLLRVAAGLESPIPGEPQVLGQVRDAYLRARRAGSVGPILDAAFRGAIRTGRRVRSETTLGRTARSYAHLALAALRIRSPRPTRIAVLGSGSLAQELLGLLARERLNVTVVSRHRDRAAALARSVAGCVAAPADRLRDVLAQVDAAVACTSTAHPIVTAAEVPPERECRRDAALFILDLGVPRNVTPQVGRRAGISLKTLEELLPQAEPNAAAVSAARQIVAGQAERYLRWLRARRVASQIARLRAVGEGMEARTSPERKRELHRRIERLKRGVAA